MVQGSFFYSATLVSYFRADGYYIFSSGRGWLRISAQAATFFRSGRDWGRFSAQNVAAEHSGRVWLRIPAQAATFFRSRRVWGRFSAQKGAMEHFGRDLRRFPAQEIFRKRMKFLKKEKFSHPKPYKIL